MKYAMLIVAAGGFAAIVGCGNAPSSENAAPNEDRSMEFEVTKTEQQWRQELTPEQYRITREKGTEPAFTGEYWNTKTPGVYQCVACGQPLYSSETKFDSGSGWPSFYAPVDAAHIARAEDASYGTVRTELTCSRCGAHLGHVFPDGPKPTGLRHCINSASLKLVPSEEKEKGDD